MTVFQGLSVLALGSLLLRELLLVILRRGPQRPRWFRSAVWLVALVAILCPDRVTAVALFLGIKRGADLVSYLAILAMLGLAFYGYSCYVRLQSQVTSLARILAILQARQAPGAQETDIPPADAHGEDVSPRRATDRLFHAWLLRGVLLIVALAAYWPSFRGAFVFDDTGNIVNNFRLQSLATLWPELVWNPRPIVYLSLWLNYQIGRLDVLGYHVFNFLVHGIAGLTLFSLVRGTLKLPPMDRRWGRWADAVAFVVALLWLVHPLQTQAVTYVIQRCESLMGMFYLLCLYSVLRASQSPRPWPWYVAGVAAGWLGMGCKEVMITAPVVILLYDRIYLSSPWAMVFRRRWGFYLALLPAMAALVVVVRHNALVPLAGYLPNTPPGRLEYLLSQPAIILHYLWLAILPGELCLDYRWPAAQGWRDVVLPGLAVLGIFAASLLALFRWPRVGFLAFSFFVILAPTSSLNPIADLAVDHRMYLPLALLIVLASLAFCYLTRRILRRRRRRILVYVAALAVLLPIYTLRTFVRNLLFTKPDAIWKNVIDHAPENGRAYNNLGCCLLAAGQTDRALRLFDRSIQLQPTAPEAYCNAARLLLRKNDPAAAVALLKRGIAAAPRSEMLHDDLGFVLNLQGKTDEAAAHYRLALQYNPRYGRSHYQLGRILQRRGELKEATAHLYAAMVINPLDVPCSFWLAMAFQRSGRFPQAVQQYGRTLELLQANQQNGRTPEMAHAMEVARRNLNLCRQGNRAGETLPDEIEMLRNRLLQR
jgi:Flp pilus assembly protein TadD